MNLADLVTELSARGVKLRVEGDQLGVSAPAGAITTVLRESLVASKPALIAWLNEVNERKRTGSPTSTLIGRVPRSDRLKLSFAQQRLWVIDQLEGKQATYNLPATLELRGNLDIKALEHALTAIVRRHEIIRTVFPTIDGAPVQRIHPPAPVQVAVIDLRSLPDVAREERVRQLARQEACLPFDLQSGPLMRTSLLRLAEPGTAGESVSILMLTMHHIVSDGWSRGILIRELSELYRAGILHQAPVLEDLPVQYVDYAHWQRDWLQGELLASDLRFWNGHLAGVPPLLELPTDRPRPAVQSFRGRTHRFTVNRDLAARVKALGHQHDATFYMTLLAAFSVLLSRYSGTDDVVIGSPVANRTRRELEPMIGFFVNTLALRVRLHGNPTFLQLLDRVKAVALQAYAHQETPFDKVVEAVQPQRSLSSNPLFQVMFVLQTTAMMVRPNLSGLSVRIIEIDRGTSMFDLTFAVEESDEGLNCAMEYSTDLFDRSTITRLAANFDALLHSIVRDPDQPIADLAIMANAEREQTLVTWNETSRPFPLDRCLHRLFEQQVERSPDALAVVSDGQALTYRELNAQANRAARALLAEGLGPEAVVALMADRDANFIAVVLAIFKAGCAYLPIDPSHPADRVAQLLEQGAIRLVVVSEEARPRLSQALEQAGATASVSVLGYDALLQSAHASENLPQHTAGPDSLAYVIYTSGSTGKPKGAMIEHRGMVNHLYAKVTDLELSAADIVAATAPQSFDISIWQFFAALLVGGRVRIFDDDVTRDPARLLKDCEREQVSILEIVPSWLHVVLEEIESRRVTPDLSRLRWLIVTGEALPPAACRRWLTLFPDIPLLNAYGPTECSDDVTHHAVRQPPPESMTSVPIGRAVANTQLYVLDASRQPVPTGVIGELYVGGAGVGRGYLGDPERTQVSFVPDPFAAGTGARLYRTGDKVRYLADGALEFLGRLDAQVKVRGFRIELEEIEVVLARHPAVRDVAVIASGAAGEPAHLYAYLVAADEQPFDSSELRQFVKQALPEYMVPSAFIALDALPTTAHGKIDRSVLMRLGAPALLARHEFVAPRTPTEALLADAWQQVLGLTRVGVHDNFFELGGDSILSIQVIARAGQAGVQVTPRLIFQHQTIAELACVAERASLVQAEQDVLIGPIALTPSQRAFCAANLADPSLFSHSLVVDVMPGLQPEWLDVALQGLVDHHDALRLALADAAHPVLAPRQPGLSVRRLDLATLSDEAQQDAIERTSQQLQRALNLAEGLLIGAAYFDKGARARLLLVVHHLAVDGLSWRILAEDLATLYRRASGEPAAHLPPKTSSTRQWAARLAAFAQSDAIAQELPYWVSVCTAPPPLPRDHAPAAGANTVASRRSVTVALTADETIVLLQDVPQRWKAEMDAVLLTALARGMAAAAGQSALYVTLEGHGRPPLFDDLDISRTVGWFTNEFPVRLEAIDTVDVVQALMSVERQLRAIPHAGVGYGALRYLHQDPAVRSRLEALPTPEISVNYVGQVNRESLPAPLLRLDEARSGLVQSPHDRRDHLVELEAIVDAGALKLDWKYSEHAHHETTIQAWADTCVEQLRSIVKSHQRGDAGQEPWDGRSAARPAVNLTHRSDDWTPIVASHARGRLPPFFCVHPIGGDVLCYSQLVRQLGTDQPFYALQAQGLAAGQDPCTRVDDMAARYVAAIRAIQPQGPYRLGGWSFGGLVAFEMARQLRTHGQEISLLALIDTDPPITVSGVVAEQTTAHLYSAFVHDLGGAFGKPLLIGPERIAALRPDERPAYVLAEATRLDVIPPGVDAAHIERLVKVFQANLRAALEYEPKPFDGDLVVFGASGASADRPRELAQAWGPHAAREVLSYDIPAAHYTILRDPYVHRVAHALQHLLAR